MASKCNAASFSLHWSVNFFQFFFFGGGGGGGWGIFGGFGLTPVTFKPEYIFCQLSCCRVFFFIFRTLK